MYKVFAFRGEMGAGKTTIVTEFCRHLGVKSSVSSPTFSVINEYRSGEETIYHLDLYRLKDENEAIQAGVEDVIYSGAICFIEWPEKVPHILPAETVWIDIEAIDFETRKLTIKGFQDH